MSEELNLAKVESKEIDKYVDSSGKPMGLEEYRPPVEWGYLNLDQKTGLIEYTLTGEKRKTWDVVVLDYNFSRIKFPAGMNASEPECKSIKPEKTLEFLQGNTYGRCIDCEFSQWTDRTPPPCKASVVLSGFVGGVVATPFSVQLRGASYKVGTGTLNMFFRAKRPLFSSILTISVSEQLHRGSVDYYEYVITEKKVLEPKDWEQFAEIYSMGMYPEKKEKDEITEEEALNILGGEVVEKDDKGVDPKEVPFE